MAIPGPQPQLLDILPPALAAAGQIPAPFAVADGVADDGPALEAASLAYSVVAVPFNKTYRIRSNRTINKVESRGGFISVDAGVTLTVGTCQGNSLSQTIFKGAGTVIIKDHWHALLWYDGADGSASWNFFLRGQSAQATGDIGGYMVASTPRSDDPRMILNGTLPMIALDGPMNFDNIVNQFTFDFQCMFKARLAFGPMWEISPVLKTEQIQFVNGAFLYGNNLATKGVMFHGGARIIMGGMGVRALNCTVIGIHHANDLWPSDEVDWGIQQEITGFGQYGILMDPIQPALATKFGHVWTNGGASGCINLGYLKGVHRDTKIDRVTENIGGGYFTWSDTHAWKIENATAGDRINVTIGSQYYYTSTKGAVRTIDSSSQTAPGMSVTLGPIKSLQTLASGYVVDLNYVTDGQIDKIGNGRVANSVNINTNCSSVALRDVARSVVNGNCDYLTFNGQAKFLIASLANGTAAGFRYDPVARTGSLTVNSGSAFADGMIGNGTFVGNKGSTTDVVTTVQTGTSGTAGRATIYDTGNILGIENQLGGTVNSILLVKP